MLLPGFLAETALRKLGEMLEKNEASNQALRSLGRGLGQAIGMAADLVSVLSGKAPLQLAAKLTVEGASSIVAKVRGVRDNDKKPVTDQQAELSAASAQSSLSSLPKPTPGKK